MDFVQQLIEQYITDPNFAVTCGIVFLIMEALQEIKRFDALESGVKRLVSMALGIGTALVIVEPSVTAAVAGLIAGGTTTLVVRRVDILTREAGTGDPEQ